MLLALEVLLLDLLLQACVELVVSGKELEVLLFLGVGHQVSFRNYLNSYQEAYVGLWYKYIYSQDGEK